MCGIIAGERTALTALFYDGTLATKSCTLLGDDASEQFRPVSDANSAKNGTFYDENSAFNSYLPLTEFSAFVRGDEGINTVSVLASESTCASVNGPPATEPNAGMSVPGLPMVAIIFQKS